MPGMDGFQVARGAKKMNAASDAISMMITSGERPGDLARCREIGIQRYLIKPVRQSQLFDAIQNAIARKTGQAGAEPKEKATPARTDLKGVRILLVEDNPVNQKLAARILEGQGAGVKIAPNGEEAIKMLNSEQFDVVLMDVQMPVMDGFEATSIIRRNPKWANIPIIAMTAHAMAGDREKCLAVGMTDYISKPIKKDEMITTIKKVLRTKEPAEPHQQRESEKRSERDAPFDTERALDVVGGDLELLREVVDVFFEEAPDLLREIREGIEQRDATRVRKAAHSLKGSVGNFGAEPAYEAARKVESLAEQNDIDGAAEALKSLEIELDRFRKAIYDFLEEKNESAHSGG